MTPVADHERRLVLQAVGTLERRHDDLVDALVHHWIDDGAPCLIAHIQRAVDRLIDEGTLVLERRDGVEVVRTRR